MKRKPPARPPPLHLVEERAGRGGTRSPILPGGANRAPATTTTNCLSNSPLTDHIVFTRNGASLMTNQNTHDKLNQKVFDRNNRLRLDFKCFLCIMLFMTQTKISKAFQTTISAEAIRMLGFRPGRRVNQIVEGKRLVLELVEDADALAGSLGKGNRVCSVEKMKESGRKGIARAGAAGLEEDG